MSVEICKFEVLDKSARAELLTLTDPWYEGRVHTLPRYCARALLKECPTRGEVVYAAFARDSGHDLIGWCVFVLCEERYTIVNTFVAEPSRGQGISGKMAKAIKDFTDRPVFFKSYGGRGVDFAEHHGLELKRYGVRR